MARERASKLTELFSEDPLIEIIIYLADGILFNITSVKSVKFAKVTIKEPKFGLQKVNSLFAIEYPTELQALCLQYRISIPLWLFVSKGH